MNEYSFRSSLASLFFLYHRSNIRTHLNSYLEVHHQNTKYFMNQQHPDKCYLAIFLEHNTPHRKLLLPWSNVIYFYVLIPISLFTFTFYFSFRLYEYFQRFLQLLLFFTNFAFFPLSSRVLPPFVFNEMKIPVHNKVRPFNANP